MMMYYSILVVFSLLCMVNGLQINMQSIRFNNLMVKDTVQEHYEFIIDDILGQHNEDLLLRLSSIIKEPHQMYKTLAPEAELILDSETIGIQDMCIAQMPGMIANQVHELGSRIYASIDSIVAQTWKLDDVTLRQMILTDISKGYDEAEVIEDLGHTLEMVNMDIVDKVIRVVEEFEMIPKVRSALITCQNVFEQETLDELNELEFEDDSATEKIWAAVLQSFKQSRTTSHNSFLHLFLIELTADIQSQLYNQIYSLAKSVYEDLAF